MNQILKNACTSTNILSQAACKGIFELNTPIRNYLNNLDPDNWQILSYNTIKKEICISLDRVQKGKQNGTTIISLTVPNYR